MACNRDFIVNAKHKIVIQEPTQTADAYGAFVTTWVTQSEVFAQILPLSGRELFLQQQNQSKVSAKFIIRYQSALKDTKDTVKKRILYDDRYYSISFIQNLDKDMKNEGTTYQMMYVEENGSSINN